ncbi:hypothetical protein NPIL_465341 [Nephila pilipes]|uniref:Uncharacterized protein n=1 Tax=Nephila pilipes TaxID=299642 RepID=A0A8X6U0N0_NEPPI|nr:hypothetical protein NPIL_465341 [Nephila pilipes]
MAHGTAVQTLFDSQDRRREPRSKNHADGDFVTPVSLETRERSTSRGQKDVSSPFKQQDCFSPRNEACGEALNNRGPPVSSQATTTTSRLKAAWQNFNYLYRNLPDPQAAVGQLHFLSS